ncbi:uncharacterized protein K441DRAFT_611493 [Cenococcum geophilum 1.58]|uniref:uncharacterized protein n=1 Tax=Cenococcum geophilum 1.58 TaxID=794803 RepID=UPI00358F88B9|nr:hypothetical protein K441DRAFT_611493 [Cenococcum geophilum 1.58]
MARLSIVSIVLGALFFLSTLISARPGAVPEDSISLLKHSGGEDVLFWRSEHSNDLVKRAPAWQFYYGYTSADHQTKFNTLTAQGYRIISISVYGSPPTYAAVWVQRSGPAWKAIHNANAAQYQAWFDANNAQGYVSILISATGTRNGAVYAGVMEQNGVSSWFQRCDMTGDNFKSYSATAGTNQQVLRSFREYGTPSDRRFCAIWHANPVYDPWTWWYTQSYSNYQQTVNSEMTKPYWRISYVTVSEDQMITSMFSNADVGVWQARHGLTAAQLQAEYETQKANGLYLINLQGGGSGSNTRYAAIFAQQDILTPRAWRAVGGAATGLKDVGGSISKVDGIMQAFMERNGVRQAQVSIGKKGSMLLERAYTWAEPSRHTTQIADPFLLASLSKAFCEAAVQPLFDSNKLKPDSKVYPLLGYTNPSDKRLNDITVQQLLDHHGGLDWTISGEIVFKMREIAIAQSGGARAATTKDVVDYMFKQPLDFTPGTRYMYSNYGYLLLSFVVEFVTKQPYYDYLKATVLDPAGLDVRKWPTAAAAHTADAVTQESAYVGLSALQPLSSNLVANVFGGDGMVKEAAFGPSALTCSASMLVKFISTHAVWGNGGRVISNRNGRMSGSRTWAESRSDGVDWALTLNTDEFPTDQNFVDLCTASITGWLDTSPTL